MYNDKGTNEFMKQRIIKKLQLLYISEKLTLIQAFLTRGHFRPPPFPPSMIAKGLNWRGLKKCCPLKENKEEAKVKYKERQRGKIVKERVKERLRLS